MKELDLFLRDHITPLLRSEGFRKSSHTYRLALPGGDWIAVGVQGHAMTARGSFYVHAAFIPQPALERQNWNAGAPLDKPARANWSPWALQLRTPDGSGLWEYGSDDERTRCAALLTDALRRALRVLRLLTQRDVLLDLVEAPLRPQSDDLPDVWRLHGGWSGLRMALLAERGPSDELQAYVDFFAGGPNRDDEWAAARAAAGHPLDENLRGAPQPRPMDTYRLLQSALDDALDQHVTPALSAAGFTRCETGYERISDAGDCAGIDVRLCWTSSDQRLVFHVVTGVEPATSQAYLRSQRDDRTLGGAAPGRASYGMAQPPLTVTWLVTALHPTQAFASPVEAHAELGLHPWAVPSARLADGFRLLALVLAEATAPFLSEMLDRRKLRDFLHDPAHRGYVEPWSEDMRAVLLLLDDEAGRAELDLRLARIRGNRHGHHEHEAFLAWVECRSGW